MSRTKLLAVVVLAAAVVAALGGGSAARATSPPESSFFSTVSVDEGPAVTTSSNGDLWANCWSNDGNLYAANGDGTGFGSANDDVVVNRIAGTPTTGLSGTELAHGAGVGKIWASPTNYTRKPTGMLCVNGTLYLAVQDLDKNFDDAPNATIAKSTDHGATWTWNTSAPMFSGGVATTIFFLDYGQDGAWNPTPSYVYAYALDHNWRTSYSDSVPNPVDLYLARIPVGSIQDASTWQWSTGANTWSTPGAISQRVAVLHDDRVIYPTLYDSHQHNLTVLSQGGVVYDQPLNRYLYTSWSEYTFELYEAPNPWGPWTHFETKDYGGYPWTSTKEGGYATTIPSKFIDSTGRNVWLQSNVCSCGGGGTSNYSFNLRHLTLTPYTATSPTNTPSDTVNLARSAPGTTPIERVAHYGNNSYWNDGNTGNSEDDWNDEAKTGSSSWWGYTWPQQETFNKVVYTTGTMFSDGGWFASNLRVQVRRNFVWTDVSGSTVSPAYPYSSAAGSNHAYTFTFPAVSGDGVRVIGVPGGTKTFTSVGELAVYDATAQTTNLVGDPGFEAQATTTVAPPWSTEGPDTHGIDLGLGFQHSGSNNAWIHPTNTATTQWNSIKQTVAVSPNTAYTLTGWVQDSGNFTGGYFGVRNGTTTTVLAETQFGAAGPYTQLTVHFNSGSNTSVTVYGGYWAPGSDSWLRLDDVSIVAG